MKKILLSAAAFAVVAVSAVAVAPTTSEAVPAFARQTGAACLSCHFQRIPKLTAMGRDYKLGAYRDTSGELLEDDALSLPMAFNGSFLFKAQIRSADNVGGAGDNLGIMYPEEAALLTGGRLGTNIGAFTEWAGGPLSYKIFTAWDLGGATLGVGLYSSDALGLGWAMQDPSNTIVRNTRASQFRPGYFRNLMQEGVSGVGAYYASDAIYVGAAANIPNAGNNPSGDVGFVALDPSLYARVAVMAELAGLDAVIGAYYAGGTNNANNLAAVGGVGAVAAFKQYGLDLQMQGDLGGASIGIYANAHLKGENPYVAAQTVATNDTGYFVTSDIAFGHAGVRVGYASHETANVNTRTTILGAWYSLAQNVELDLEANINTSAGATTTVTTLLIEYVY